MEPITDVSNKVKNIDRQKKLVFKYAVVNGIDVRVNLVGNTVESTCFYLENIMQVTVNGNELVPLVAILVDHSDIEKKKPNSASKNKNSSQSRFGRRWLGNSTAAKI